MLDDADSFKSQIEAIKRVGAVDAENPLGPSGLPSGSRRSR
jgi:hypothetical protein